MTDQAIDESRLAPPTPDSLRSFALAEAQRQGVPPEWIDAIGQVESGWKPNKVGSSGERGPMQLMPGTAQELGVVDPNNPYQNIQGGVAYFKKQLDTHGTPQLAAAAYNAGPGAVAKAGGIPNNGTTLNYVKTATALAARSSAAGQSDQPVDESRLMTTGPATTQDRAQAGASGINKAVLTGLTGLPVNTALNVANLARAGYGYLGNKLGMLTPDQMPGMLDPSQFVGSTGWLQDKFRDNGAGNVIDPNRPDDPVSKWLHIGGQGVGYSLAPAQGVKQAFANAAQNGIGAIAGQAVGEATGNPGWGALASLAPQSVTPLVPMITRGAFRGGEAGQQQLKDRIAALQQAGIQEPSVGLATGNRRTQALESALAVAPGSAGVMAKKGAQVNADLGARASGIAGDLSPTYGLFDAGQTIQQGIKGPGGYKDRLQGTIGNAYDRVSNLIPDSVLFPAANTLAAGQRLSADIPGMPNVSKLLKPDVIPKVNAAMQADTAPQPAQVVPLPSGLLGTNGQPFTMTIPAQPGGITFPALKDVRTLIGQDLGDAHLVGNKTTGALKQFYSALSGDMTGAATAADAINGGGPSAVTALSRANSLNQRGMDRLDTLQPFANASAPEQAYMSLERSLPAKASTAQQVMASLTPAERNVQAATLADRLGRAKPGQQNAEGTAFSPETFLTNWNTLSPEGKQAIFGSTTQGQKAAAQLNTVARASDMMRQQSKVYANPSGTAGKSALLTGLGTAGGALLTGHPTVAGSIMAGIGTANVSARLMTNPTFVKWLADSTALPSSRLQAHLQRLAGMAQVAADPQTKAEMYSILSELNKQPH